MISVSAAKIRKGHKRRGTKGTVLFVPLIIALEGVLNRGTKRTVPFVPLVGEILTFSDCAGFEVGVLLRQLNH